ncbi:MAG: hypothetical protein C4323_05935 [Mastigocladus sp. ERB_26_2]
MWVERRKVSKLNSGDAKQREDVMMPTTVIKSVLARLVNASSGTEKDLVRTYYFFCNYNIGYLNYWLFMT